MILALSNLVCFFSYVFHEIQLFPNLMLGMMLKLLLISSITPSGISLRDGRFVGGAPLRDAREGDIVQSSPGRVVPLPQPNVAHLGLMEPVTVEIQG